jgi:hypothetical protein
MTDQIYNIDFQSWIDQTISQLKNREFESLDVNNLIEELTDLGKSERNALKSNLTILLAHLLKLRIQADAPEMMKGSWYSSVLEHRQRVLDSLDNTPSLKRYLEENVDQAYLNVRKLAIKGYRLARYGVQTPEESEYPTECPFEISQILDEDFYASNNAQSDL